MTGAVERDIDQHLAELDEGEAFAQWAEDEGLNPDDPETADKYQRWIDSAVEDWMASTFDEGELD